MACRAGSRSVCGSGSLDPAGTPHLGESAKRIHRDPGVLAGESWMGPDVRQLASAFRALYPRGSEERRPVNTVQPVMLR